MTVLTALAGTAVLVITLIDIVATTISAGLPGGFVTRRCGLGMWRLLVRRSGDRHAVLQVGGLMIVLSVIVTWIGLLLAGWALLLGAVGDLEHVSTGVPASAWDVLYYAGYSVSTMGNGDMVATTDVGRLLTVATATSGLLVLTLSITYLVPVLGAAAHKRQLAATIHALGPAPEHVAERLWPGGDLTASSSLTIDLAARIREMTQQHYSYPVLHFFHSRHRRTAVAPAVAVLDEALTSVIEPGQRLPVSAHLLREAIGELLETLASSFVKTPATTPPEREIRRPAGVGTLEVDLDVRRRRLAGFCLDDGWTWEDLIDPDPRPTS